MKILIELEEQDFEQAWNLPANAQHFFAARGRLESLAVTHTVKWHEFQEGYFGRSVSIPESGPAFLDLRMMVEQFAYAETAGAAKEGAEDCPLLVEGTPQLGGMNAESEDHD